MMTRLASFLSLCCFLSAACTDESGLVLSNVDQASSAADLATTDLATVTVPDFASSSTDGVQCGSVRCDIAAGKLCCPSSHPSTSDWMCTDNQASCFGVPDFRVTCSDSGDCSSGENCCVDYDFSGDYLAAASCRPKAQCPSNYACLNLADCAMGFTCKALPGEPWLSTCR